MSNLDDIQTWFSHAVIVNSEEDQRLASSFLLGSTRQTSAQRLDIYTSDFWPRCLESLSDDFRSLLNYLGKETFNSMMKAYVMAYPSHTFTLFYLGKYMSKFVKETYKEGDKQLVQDLVDFDWAELSASIAENSPIFDPLLLTADEQERLSEMRLRLHPSVSLLMCSGQQTIVYRKAFKVYHKLLEPLCFDLFSAIGSGLSLSDAIDSISENLDDDALDQLSSHIQSWFQLAVQEQWLVHPI